jgi:hypothetical protein
MNKLSSGPKARMIDRKEAAERDLVSRAAKLSHLNRGLRKISVAISLMFLSLGFFSLALSSYYIRPSADLGNVATVVTGSSLAGTLASLLAGISFLVGAVLYWRQYPEGRRL